MGSYKGYIPIRPSVVVSGKTKTEEEPKYETNEEMLNHHYEEDLAKIDADTQKAEAEVDVWKARAIVDADTSYRKNMAEYGTNADRLARMGLTGSGYASYLNEQNYGAYRSEVQGIKEKAAADKQAITDKADELKYNLGRQHDTDIITNRTNSNNTAMGLIGEIGKGTYTASQASEILRQYGIDPTSYEKLFTDAEARYKATTTEETRAAKNQLFIDFADMLAGGVSFDVVKTLADQSGLGADHINALGSISDQVTEEKNKQAIAAQMETFANLIEMSATGKYTQGQISQMAKDSGLGEPYIRLLNENIIDTGIEYGSFETMADLSDALQSAGIVEGGQQYKDYISKYQESNYEQIMYDIGYVDGVLTKYDDSLTFEELKKLKDTQEISPERFEEIVALAFPHLDAQGNFKNRATLTNTVKENGIQYNIYDINGVAVKVKAGHNPYTNDKNDDTVDGTFSNGYQPDNIRGEKLKKTNTTKMVAGKYQKVWKLKSTGQLYIWDGMKNQYVPYTE